MTLHIQYLHIVLLFKQISILDACDVEGNLGIISSRMQIHRPRCKLAP